MFIVRLLKKYPRVIISQRNNGLGDNLLAAANAWCHAKHTNRALVIVWQPSRYLADKKVNAFSHFFKVPDKIEGVPVVVEPSIDPISTFLISHPLYYLPFPDPVLLIYKLFSKITKSAQSLFKERLLKKKGVTDRIIKNNEDIQNRVLITHSCYAPNDSLKLFFDSLKLNSEFQEKVDWFAERNFKNKKVIGVHIRYYNRSMAHSDHTKYWQDQVGALCVCLNKIKEAAAGLKQSDYVVFLSTDSGLVHDFISQSVENLVFYEKDFGSDISQELHQELPVETATSTVIEMFLLAKSDILVRFPHESWFSYYASLYAKEVIV